MGDAKQYDHDKLLKGTATAPAGSQSISSDKLAAGMGVPRRARPVWDVSMHWLAAQAGRPAWLPEVWRSAWVSYGLAVVATAVSGTLLTVLTVVTSGHIQVGSPLLLVDVLVALAFGPGPSLLAALLSTFLVDYVIFVPHFSWAHTDPHRAVTVLVFGLVGCAISLLASRVERARAQAELLAKALQTSEQETVQRMDEFLGVASHELKTPLTAILANVQLAKRMVRDHQDGAQMQMHLAQVAQMLERAERQARRQDRLINDLLEMSRMRADKLQFAVAEYDMTELVREGVDEQRRMHPGRRIDLRLALPAGMTRVTAWGDVDRIGQVLANYLSNALKYSPDETPVAVTLAVQDDNDSCSGSGISWTRVAVRDAGPGLSPESQRQVWERFYRVPGVEVQSGSGVGLGLGLYISREIITRHGGRVGVDSVLGHGATFWFELPSTTPPVN